MGFVVSKFLYMPPQPSYDLESFPHSLIFIPLNPDIPLKDVTAKAIPALYIHRKDAKRIMLYCHGNAADLGLIYPEACHLSHHLNCHVVCVEYPGYGPFFPGTPSESNTVATVLTVVEYLHHEMGCELSSMILYGRSLGTAIVTQVASILTKKYPNTYPDSEESSVAVSSTLYDTSTPTALPPPQTQTQTQTQVQQQQQHPITPPTPSSSRGLNASPQTALPANLSTASSLETFTAIRLAHSNAATPLESTNMSSSLSTAGSSDDRSELSGPPANPAAVRHPSHTRSYAHLLLNGGKSKSGHHPTFSSQTQQPQPQPLHASVAKPQHSTTGPVSPPSPAISSARQHQDRHTPPAFSSSQELAIETLLDDPCVVPITRERHSTTAAHSTAHTTPGHIIPSFPHSTASTTGTSTCTSTTLTTSSSSPKSEETRKPTHPHPSTATQQPSPRSQRLVSLPTQPNILHSPSTSSMHPALVLSSSQSFITSSSPRPSMPKPRVARIQMLRSKTPLCGLILHSPFTSVNDIIRGAAHSSLFLQDQYITRQYLKDISCPTLFIHGMKDKLIPYSHSQTLMDVSNGVRKRLHLCPNADHNNFDFYFEVLTPIGQFIRQYCHNRHTVMDIIETDLPTETGTTASHPTDSGSPLYQQFSQLALATSEGGENSYENTDGDKDDDTHHADSAPVDYFDNIESRGRSATTIVHPMRQMPGGGSGNGGRNGIGIGIARFSSPQQSPGGITATIAEDCPSHGEPQSQGADASFITYDSINDPSVWDLPPTMVPSVYSSYRSEVLNSSVVHRHRHNEMKPNHAGVGSPHHLPPAPHHSRLRSDEPSPPTTLTRTVSGVVTSSTKMTSTITTTTTTTVFMDGCDDNDQFLGLSLPESLFKPPRSVRLQHRTLRGDTKFQSSVCRYPIRSLATPGPTPKSGCPSTMPPHLAHLEVSDDDSSDDSHNNSGGVASRIMGSSRKIISKHSIKEPTPEQPAEHRLSHDSNATPPRRRQQTVARTAVHHSPARTRRPIAKTIGKRKLSVQITIPSCVLPSHDAAMSPSRPPPRLGVLSQHSLPSQLASSPDFPLNDGHGSDSPYVDDNNNNNRDHDNTNKGHTEPTASLPSSGTILDDNSDYNYEDEDEDEYEYEYDYDDDSAEVDGQASHVEPGGGTTEPLHQALPLPISAEIRQLHLQNMRKSLSQSAANDLVSLFPASYNSTASLPLGDQQPKASSQ